jgi:hypothetical protein
MTSMSNALKDAYTAGYNARAPLTADTPKIDIPDRYANNHGLSVNFVSGWETCAIDKHYGLGRFRNSPDR